MLTKVAENIYRKTVPLPNNPLRDINAYIITGEKNLLIDTASTARSVRRRCKVPLKSLASRKPISLSHIFIQTTAG